MILTSVELTNFKRHAHLLVDFTPGSNMIVGKNYQGKTTILEAILVGMFGNAAAPGTTERLIRRGSTDFQVKLTFSTGLVSVRTSKNSSLFRAGADKPFAQGHTAVNKAMADELGLDRGSFTKIFASPQGTPQKLLEMEGAELQRFIEACIGIEDLDRVAKDANRAGNKFLDQAGLLTTFLLSKEDLEVAMQEKVDAEAEVSTKGSQLEQTRLDLALAQSDCGTATASLETGNKENDARRLYNRKLEQFSSMKLFALLDTEDLSQRLDAARALRESSSKRTPLLQKRSTLEAQVERLNGLRSRVVDVQQDTVALEEELVSAKEPVFVETEVFERRKDLIESRKDLERDIERIKDMVENAFCPSCNRPFEEGNHLEDWQQSIGAIGADLKATVAVIVELDTECAALHKAHADEVANWRRTFADKRAELARLRAENQRIEAELVAIRQADVDYERVSSELSQVNTELSGLPEVDHNALVIQVANLTDELKHAHEENGRIASNNKRYQEAQADLESTPRPESLEVVDLSDTLVLLRDAQHRVTEYSTNIEVLSEGIGRASRKLDSLKLKLSDHHENTEKHQELTAKAAAYWKIHRVLVNSRSRIITESLASIFAVATEFAKACTDGDIEEVLIHEDAISYKEGGAIMSKHSASGAQKTLMGIGMKLGLVRLSRSIFDSLLLDEISADMDPDISMRCAMLLGSFCGQSIAVSHRTMDVAANVIEL